MSAAAMSSYRCETAREMLQRKRERRQYMSTGCPILDATLGGGFPCGGITELVGEAGCGKTQFCLSLALRCVLPEEQGGMGGTACYLTCGEGSFPVSRLSQLMQCYQQHGAPSLLSKVLIDECRTSEDVMDNLLRRLPQKCKSDDVRLVIIDSVAGMYRTEYDTSVFDDVKQRTMSFFRLSTELKILADAYHLCVVVVNQVTAAVSNSNGHSSCDPSLLCHAPLGSSFSHQPDPQPALGLSWTHCINTRIILRRDARGFLSSWNNSEGHDENDHNGGRVELKLGPEPEHVPNSADPLGVAMTAPAPAPVPVPVPVQAGVPAPGVRPLAGMRRLLLVEFSPLTRQEGVPCCGYVITNGGVKGCP